MSRILIAYSTVDGHTLKIANRIKAVLEQAAHPTTLAEISPEDHIDPGPYSQIIVGGSIRYGKYRPALFDFIESNREVLESRPSAFFSVNLVARKENKNTPDTNPYILKTFRKNTSWVPDAQAVFAGKVDYARYGFWDRQIIRLIMLMTHGPTDASASIEFTNWQAVDSFAQRLVQPVP